ncbi:MAG: uncharacterized protein QOD59_3091, partial [Mycobacterium sp.]|nr:uncharacterized protein [Mycobacterium sp.]
IAAHPDRFNALATLPTQDPAAAIVEAKRAITELGFCGVVINGHTQGRFLDAPEFDGLLTAIEELDVPIYLHPTYPPQQVADVYFSGLPEQAGRALATAAWDGTPRPACTCCGWRPRASSPVIPNCRSSSGTWVRTCRSR